MGKKDLNPDFTRCTEKGKIVTFAKGPSLVLKERDSANDDLTASKDSLARGNYKWATTGLLFNVSHSTGANLCKEIPGKESLLPGCCLGTSLCGKGFREKGFVESLVIGKEMRESAVYHSIFSKEGAENLIRAAEAFWNSAGKLVKK